MRQEGLSQSMAGAFGFLAACQKKGRLLPAGIIF
jgi:hypothetical protein